MRVAVYFVIAVFLIAGVRAAEYAPADPGKPLFRIFAPIPIKTPADTHREQLTFDDKHPLLVVRSVSNLVLGADNKSVLIKLTPDDAKKFAAITRNHKDDLLLLEADGRILHAMSITSPIVDGIIGFKYPQEETVAEYLRRRFRIAEFK